MKTISIIDLTESLHFKEIVDGFISFQGDRYKFIDYKTNRNHKRDYCLVLGAHTKPELLSKLEVERGKLIIYNLEQFADGYGWLSGGYKSILKNNLVLDYSLANEALYREIGSDFTHLPVPIFDSFVDPHLSENTMTFGEPIYDLIIFGMECPRRREIALELTRAGFNVAYGTNIWGGARFNALKNSSAVLNLHVHEGGFLETTRLNYCIVNGFPVISESSPGDPLMEIYSKYVRFIHPRDISAQIAEHLKGIRTGRLKGLDVREKLRSELSPALIETALDQLIERASLERDRESCYVNEDQKVKFSMIEAADPESGLAFDDVVEAAAGLDYSSLVQDVLENTQIILNKYPYFAAENEHSFWQEILGKGRRAKHGDVRDLVKIYSGLVDLKAPLLLGDLLKNSRTIAASFKNILVERISTAEDSLIETYAIELASMELDCVSDWAWDVVDALIDQLIKRGYEEAGYRICIAFRNQQKKLDAKLHAKYAAFLYERGDLTAAVKSARVAVSQGFASPGLVNLAKAPISRYPEEYKRAREVFADVVKEIVPVSKVLAALSVYKDPAEFVQSHSSINYGGLISDSYDVKRSSQTYEGIVYGADKLIKFDKSNLGLKKCKFLAIVGHYNESDILFWTVDSLKRQGAEVIVVDNWSDDNEFERVKSIAANFDCVVHRYPEQPTGSYDWKKILDFKSELARAYNGYWVAHQDADEIRLSSLLGFEFNEMLSYADYLGFNAIDHLVLNVRPTNDTFVASRNPFMVYSYFDFGGSDLSKQIKTWKQGGRKVDLSGTGGHSVSFLHRKVFPLRQFLFHFPIRNTEQGARKIYRERLPRFLKEERSKGWHVHYDEFLKSSSEKVDLFDQTRLLPMFDFRAMSAGRLFCGGK
ncbi:MAG: glycosyltransferase family 2 protein [Hylemonella sp.]|nr:glycosyltransferase family 2 protein [Hylemonella sp.]